MASTTMAAGSLTTFAAASPDGLHYHGSWVTDDFRRCFQVMECDDRVLLEQWMANWRDLVDFQVIPVQTSADAAAAIAPRL